MPETNIAAPPVTQEFIQRILRDRYGIECGGVEQLPGYDDKNYHCTQLTWIDSPNHADESQLRHGCVFKVTNVTEANIPDLVGE